MARRWPGASRPWRRRWPGCRAAPCLTASSSPWVRERTAACCRTGTRWGRWPGGGRVAELDLRLVCFDCLEDGGQRLDEQPWRARRARLEALVHGAPPSACLTPVCEFDPAVHVHLVGLGFEGSVLKRAGSRYRRGQRSRSWLKRKQRRHADVLVRFAGRDRRSGRVDRAAFTEPEVAGLQWASLGTVAVREVLERGAQDVPGRIAFSHRSARGGARGRG